MIIQSCLSKTVLLRMIGAAGLTSPRQKVVECKLSAMICSLLRLKDWLKALSWVLLMLC